MNPIDVFAAFEGKVYAATTQRVYLSAAKKALKIVGKTAENSGSYEGLHQVRLEGGDTLLALLRENLAQKKLPKAQRIGPFLSFLDSKIAKYREDIVDYGPIRALGR